MLFVLLWHGTGGQCYVCSDLLAQCSLVSCARFGSVVHSIPVWQCCLRWELEDRGFSLMWCHKLVNEKQLPVLQLCRVPCHLLNPFQFSVWKTSSLLLLHGEMKQTRRVGASCNSLLGGSDLYTLTCAPGVIVSHRPSCKNNIEESFLSGLC